MKEAITGFAYSFTSKTGKEHLAMSTFGVSKTKAKRRLKVENFGKRLEPLVPTGLWAVSIVPLERIG